MSVEYRIVCEKHRMEAHRRHIWQAGSHDIAVQTAATLDEMSGSPELHRCTGFVVQARVVTEWDRLEVAESIDGRVEALEEAARAAARRRPGDSETTAGPPTPNLSPARTPEQATRTA